MNEPGFIRAGESWHYRVKNFFVHGHDLMNLGFKKDDNLPFKIEVVLKERAVVPKDSYLEGYFYPWQQNGVVLRFHHLSFPEINACDLITQENVDLSA